MSVIVCNPECYSAKSPESTLLTNFDRRLPAEIVFQQRKVQDPHLSVPVEVCSPVNSGASNTLEECVHPYRKVQNKDDIVVVGASFKKNRDYLLDAGWCGMIGVWNSHLAGSWK